jgi:hypothetical protein
MREILEFNSCPPSDMSVGVELKGAELHVHEHEEEDGGDATDHQTSWSPA